MSVVSSSVTSSVITDPKLSQLSGQTLLAAEEFDITRAAA